MSSAKFGIVIFPGSNCDHDAYNVLKHIYRQDVKFLWHKESSLGDRNVVIIPGGFSYGDYLRCGAIARFSNLMKEIVRFAEIGGTVLGICNGFQILCEAGLLPGVLLRNAILKFVCNTVTLKIRNKNTLFTSMYNGSLNIDEIKIPVAHAEGNYFCNKDTLESLFNNNQVIFEYKENPNGSLKGIAGIMNKKGNVLGMMPHPERASEELLGSSDGKYLFESIIENFN